MNIVKEDGPKTEKKTSQPIQTWQVMKNVVVISLAFMVHFTAYNGAANLQSSINAEADVGTASLAAVYTGLIFSNMFLPAVVIKCLGKKWTMILSFITYMPYIAAQFKPTFYTMIPAALIVGLGGGPLWCAKCSYLSMASKVHSNISKIPTDVLLTRFMGLFFMIFFMNQVWGNLISYLILSSGDNAAAVTSVNASLIPELCGANFLPATDAGDALPQQPPEKIQLIAGIYLACMAGASLIVAVGVDSTKGSDSETEIERSHSGLALLAVTLKLLAEPNQLLLVIINIFVGFQAAFFGADFTAAFVSCAVGTGSVGFVMMISGLADITSCVVIGYLPKGKGRFFLICAATVIHMALCVTILAWKPQVESGYVLYVIAVFWGFCDSIWVVQITAYYGILFPGREEAAYSSFHLWESVGYIIAYAISPYLRTSSKTYLILVMLVIGVAGYFAVEIRERSRRQRQSTDNSCREQNTGSDQVESKKSPFVRPFSVLIVYR